MTRDSEIICFKHCGSDSIFCNKVPKECPLCGSEIFSYILEPFVIPYPCCDAAQKPCTIAVRPSNGNFVESYTSSDDLHIAVVNSQGQVFEFDQCGLIIDNAAAWMDCLTLEAIPQSWRDHWDCVLSELCQNPKWTAQNYDENFTNCFTFVIDFFKNLNHPDFKFSSKAEFCEVFVLPKIQETLRYAQLYRKISSKDYCIG